MHSTERQPGTATERLPGDPRLAALVMGSTMLLFGAASGILGPLLPAIGREFGVGASRSGLLFSLTFAGAILATLAGGYLADLFGKKRLFVIVLGGLALAYLGVWQAPTFTVLAAACLLTGAFGGTTEGLCSAIIADLDPGRLHRNMNLLQVAFCAGAVLAVAAASPLRHFAVSWRVLYGLFALSAVLLWLASLGMRVSPAPPGETIRPADAWRLLRDPGLRRLALAIGLYVSAEMSLAWLISPILQSVDGRPESVAVWGAGAFWAAMGAGRVGVALLCQRHPGERLLKISVCAGMAVFGFLLVPLAPWRLWVGAMLAGFACGGVWPLLVSLANARHPAFPGTVTALMVTSGTVGGLAGPYLAVRLLEADPSARSSFLFMTAAFAGLAWLVLSLPGNRPGRP